MDKTLSAAIVTFEGPSVTVSFTGMWTKRMVDIAHNHMLNNLPAHIATVRKNMESESKPKKEKAK